MWPADDDDDECSTSSSGGSPNVPTANVSNTPAADNTPDNSNCSTDHETTPNVVTPIHVAPLGKSTI